MRNEGEIRIWSPRDVAAGALAWVRVKQSERVPQAQVANPAVERLGVVCGEQERCAAGSGGMDRASIGSAVDRAAFAPGGLHVSPAS